MIGLITAAALLLGAAGLAKMVRPGQGPPWPLLQAGLRRTGLPPGGALRLVGLVEVSVAGYGGLAGGRTAAAVLALTYLGLLIVSWRLLAEAPGADCGCFGAADSPASGWHIAVNAVAAFVALVAVTVPAPSWSNFVRATPVSAVAMFGAACALAGLGYAAMTAVPELNRAHARLVAPR